MEGTGLKKTFKYTKYTALTKYYIQLKITINYCETLQNHTK